MPTFDTYQYWPPFLYIPMIHNWWVIVIVTNSDSIIANHQFMINGSFSMIIHIHSHMWLWVKTLHLWWTSHQWQNYVDDLAISVQEWEDFGLIFQKLASHLKHTGTLQQSQQGGGKMTFLGRELCRQANLRYLCMWHPNYLDSCFKEYGITNANRAAAPNDSDRRGTWLRSHQKPMPSSGLFVVSSVGCIKFGKISSTSWPS